MSLILPNGLGRRSIDVNEKAVQVLINLEPVLRSMQLHLVCPRCLANGLGAQALVGGDNTMEDAAWKVSCACTDRTYRRGQAS